MHERTRTEYSLLNIMTGIGGYVLNTFLGFLCRMVFVRCLTADYLGVNGLFTNILSMLSLAELGVGNAIVFALYKPLAEHDEEKIAALMQVYAKAYRVIGLVIFAAGLALMPYLNWIIPEQPNIDESIHLLYAINLFNTAISYLFSYRGSLLIAAQRNYLVSGLNYLITIIQSVLQMVFLLVFGNYLGYLLIQTTGTLFYNVLVSYTSTKQFPFLKYKAPRSLPEHEKKTLVSNIRDLMIYKVSGLLVNSTDNILITFFSGLTATGIASNYTLLVNTLSSLLDQGFNALTASIGNHNATESREKRYEMFCFLNKMNLWIYGWAALGICFCSSDLVKLCFGESYVLPDEIPFILALNFYVLGGTSVVRTYKHTLGLFHKGRFIQLFTGITNILLSIVFGTWWGLFGILAATSLSRICTHFWYTPNIVFRYGFRQPPIKYWKAYLHQSVLLLVSALLCRMSFFILDGPWIFQLVMKILLCSVIPNVLFAFAIRKSPEYAMLIKYAGILLQKNKAR